MAKYEAVDRLMALAMEKRADRLPDAASPVLLAPEGVAREAPQVVASGSAGIDPGATGAPAPRGRQILDAIRPFLPAVAGAMRLVDHGAVQAVARILPLLGGAPAPQAGGPTKAGAPPVQEVLDRAFADQQGLMQAMRKEVDALTLRLTGADDAFGRLRSQVERLAADQSSRDREIRALADRVRLLSAGLIILLMLIIVQMILLVVLRHR